MKKNLQKSAILFSTKSNAYLQINCPIFAYSWLFLPILTYLRICSKSPRIYFAFHAKYSCLFLPIFRHLTCIIVINGDAADSPSKGIIMGSDNATVLLSLNHKPVKYLGV